MIFMLMEILIEFLGECPHGLEPMYILMGFVLLLLGFLIVFMIFNSFFKLFKRGR